MSQQARAFKIRPYPCIGKVAFLDFWASKHPVYTEVLSRLKSGQSLLDAGCCFGQDLRKLLFDGAPSSSVLHGLDIEPAFFDLGYQLFRDRHKMHAKFISADLTNPSIPHINPFDSSIDIVSAVSLFHLFDLRTQKTVAQHLVRLTKPKAGSMIFGFQLGTPEPVEQHATYTDSVVFHHNPESFDTFWQEVGAATGTKWQVNAKAEKMPEASWRPDTNLLIFAVRRE